MDSYQKQDRLLLPSSSKLLKQITTDQVCGNQLKLEILNKHLILNPSVETYWWFLAICYNKWQILNTVTFLYHHKYQRICLAFGKKYEVWSYTIAAVYCTWMSFVFSYIVNLWFCRLITVALEQDLYILYWILSF